MRRIEEEVVPPSGKGWIKFTIGVAIAAVVLVWCVQHLINGCTGFPDLFTYCSGSTGSVLITK